MSTNSRRFPTFDESGVIAHAAETLIRIAWSEITAIYAYKKDCLAEDQIRLIISNGEWEVEFTEDDKDFDKLREYIEAQIKVLPDWFHKLITSPAFKTNWMVVYPYDEAIGGTPR